MSYSQFNPYIGVHNYQTVSNNHQLVAFFTARIPTFFPFNSASEHDNRKRVKVIRLTLNRPGSPFHTGPDCHYHACLYLFIEGNYLESPRWLQINMTQQKSNDIVGSLWIQWCTVAPPPPSHPLDALDLLAAPASTVGSITELICRDHGI